MPTLTHVVREDTFQDVHQQSRAVEGWTMQYVQLSRGCFAGSTQQLHLPGIHLFRERNNATVNQFGMSPPGKVMFGVALSLAGDIRANGYAIPADCIGLLASGTELDAVQPPMDLMVLTVEAAELDAMGIVDHPVLVCKEPIMIGGRAAQTHAFGQSLREILDAASECPELLRDATGNALRDELLSLIQPLLACCGPAPRLTLSVFGRTQLVRRARGFMLEHIDQSLQVSDLCRALGTSRRELQYGFQQVTGFTPATYLRLLRLNGARRDLLQAAANGLQVKDVIARWGFWHFSRFSADYRRMYGELPSVTLARAGAFMPRRRPIR